MEAASEPKQMIMTCWMAEPPDLPRGLHTTSMAALPCTQPHPKTPSEPLPWHVLHAFQEILKCTVVLSSDRRSYTLLDDCRKYHIEKQFTASNESACPVMPQPSCSVLTADSNRGLMQGNAQRRAP